MTKRRAAATLVALGAASTIGTGLVGTQVLASIGSGTGTAGGQGATPTATKTPTAEPPPKSLTIGRIDISGLSPGVSITRNLTITNNNNSDVELRSVQTSLSGPSPTPTVGSCTSPADIEVIVAGFNASTGEGTPVTIRKNKALDATLTVRMNNRPVNQDACKGRTWTFTFTATATSK